MANGEYPIQLVFTTQEEAVTANAQIEVNMLIEAPNSWAMIRQRLDGKRFFQKPEERFLDNVIGAESEEYEREWLPIEDC